MKPAHGSEPPNAVVEVLLVGYCSILEGDTAAEKACSTVSLVEEGTMRVICDPGSLPKPGVLISELEKRGLSIADIDWVFLTHSHLDHCKYAGLFPNARILDYWGVWDGDVCRAGIRKISENIHGIETPGHTADSLSLLVETAQGKVAVCGDVFWYDRGDCEDPYAVDVAALARSRERLLRTADFIVPGHGKIFKTDRRR